MSAALRPAELKSALPRAVAKLDPRTQIRQPVVFVVWLSSVYTTALAVVNPSVFAWSVTVFLWATVLFANLAEAVAEGRGRAQAESLRKAKTETVARRKTATGEEQVAGSQLHVGDLVIVEAGEVIPGDGDVVEGMATVDESAITGESAPVVRESGGDRCAVTGGTRVLSDRIVVEIKTEPGKSFIDRMIGLVEGANRQKTPNEIALNILLTVLTIIFLLAVATLQPMAIYSGGQIDIVVLVALLVCLIPTTIGALLSAIGIAGMDRLVQRNVIAKSGRAVEAAGDVSTLLLDKTGTITYGNRRATSFHPVAGVDEYTLAGNALLASLADETPEGRSIVDLAEAQGHEVPTVQLGTVVPFTAQTRMSGVDLPDGTRIRKGASAAVLAWVAAEHGSTETLGAVDIRLIVDEISASGGTPLVVAYAEPGAAPHLHGVVHLKDVVKEGMAERFAQLRAMGIRTVMVTGDNPLTAKAIADEAGVDDYLAEATPEDKLALIKRQQEGGRLVAMTGDGTNDAPALAQADVGVAMNTGTSAAKEAGNMIDLDSDPTKLIDVVEIGKQLLITRGALTTFSIANDVAKYFAIIPAMFVPLAPQLDVLNVMRLSSPQSAILSAVIFNALIIVALIPLAMRGVKYTAKAADKLLARNLTIYGLGGIVVPFIGIKLIDLVVSLLPGLS
ncbi:Potassium-transporting ATPase ATP-binding subunit OS=Tsukamurella paurometabola (strain ATCC 8368/ DSM / CCUG 35730 / CIP 100753 / JCM 10117 / KCTC 9821/ NBRC 16120 / NCIMB 702349 / NCTC 13040) OX=521096 GN=kdpB PE=3 SV=1 [Tsukamurella paurometabola]|uniref:Potassium-transporting ATPase ATP-binding subunit n=1 Tax=Tsukamurella paurometabola (strain ATCC 8368 / DSM 20162 / CCUG 35730 / CIP 100753 / JCM 10117 / KCTC 9821 / NBRC 16120 / NCIMB 702349 / NCTC 13040) TaxID=521096 RepID=D5UVP8_TSUPD|nr:potassium-transporting ATPase subunit KdpB [Tsukamurella paurometabola]ADG79830.1 K+-transporting ATPase, B subunit [Tsukamurella paurometabola DSM 20162]SUP37363.1 Potassium-transporting ATPase B chain [Tsukamurella paurometabola]